MSRRSAASDTFKSFDLTNDRRAANHFAVSRDEVRLIQRLYPQIYLACHVDHVRAATTSWRLSARDSALLAHLRKDAGTRPGALARHLGVRPSSLSAAIARLSRLGYLRSEPVETDRRQRELFLTALGDRAMSATSVLDPARVRAMLGRLGSGTRREALRGLALLAEAAMSVRRRK
jgi:DNA-binding MarR family transcriptional regulator